MCRSREQDFMVSRGAKFIDGTRCEHDGPVAAGSVSACLNGECKVMFATLRRDSSLYNKSVKKTKNLLIITITKKEVSKTKMSIKQCKCTAIN